jgi:hypothetical protein
MFLYWRYSIVSLDILLFDKHIVIALCCLALEGHSVFCKPLCMSQLSLYHQRYFVFWRGLILWPTSFLGRIPHGILPLPTAVKQLTTTRALSLDNRAVKGVGRARKGCYVLVGKHGVAKLLESYSDLTSNNTRQYEFWHSSTNKMFLTNTDAVGHNAKAASWSDSFHGYPRPVWRQ